MKKGQQDPLEKQMELALSPGTFVHDRACFSFVSGLEGAAAQIDSLLKEDAAHAAQLYETFFAACHLKAEEVDDSSGYFGQFAQDLICRWIQARQASGFDTDHTASTLLAWMEDDPYGFCYAGETQFTEALGPAELAALEGLIRARLEARSVEESYDHRRWRNLLGAIYIAQRNAVAYEALAMQTGLNAQDCLVLARISAESHADLALQWVERGIDIEQSAAQGRMASYELRQFRRKLLSQLGRGAEAIEMAWAEYLKHPSPFGFDELMQLVPEAQRAEWREKALDAAHGADLSSVMQLLTENRERERLANLVKEAADDILEKISHYVTEPAAAMLESSHPDLAARLWKAQAFRILEAGKSKYYDAAVANLERARRCYEQAGLAGQWEATIRRVRASHFRKMRFMAAFASVVAGLGYREPPSFLERAKQRWNSKHGESRS